MDVDVWTARAAEGPDTVLSPEERGRAASLRGDRHRVRYVSAHTLLRCVLARRTGASPAEIAIARRPCLRCGRPHGKPFVAGEPSLRFSLSHSGDLAVVAVAAGHEVGVDVEDLSKKRDIAGLAAKTLSARERRFFDESGNTPETFLRLWTRKEAVLKATGAGITRRLSSVSIPPGEQTVSFDGVWTLADLDPADGYVAALAVEGTQARVRLQRWEP